MKLLLSFFTTITWTIARNGYWFYRSLLIKTGKKPILGLPFIVEGRGKITMGDYVKISRSVTLSCSRNCSMHMGNQVKIGSNVKLSVSKDSHLTLGNNSSIGDHTHCYAHNNWDIGNNVRVATHCQIFSREPGFGGSLKIAGDTNIGDFSLIDVSDNITIGHMVAIGPSCTIYTHDHDYKEEHIAAPWKGRPLTRPVVIEDGAWIGSKVTILPGVTIGKNAIVATGSVVNKDVPPYTMYAGVPAKQVKTIPQ